MTVDYTIEDGYIIIARVMRYSEIWHCSANTLKVGLYLLMSAKYADSKVTGLTRGQCRKSYSRIADDCTVSHKMARTAVEKLKEIDFITTEIPKWGSQSGFTITILNYEKYQDPDNYKGSPVKTKATKPKPKKKAEPKEQVPFEQMKPKDRITYDKDTGKLEGILAVDYNKWEQAFPAVDYDMEIAQMELWLGDNPSKAPRSNYHQFMTTWFRRTQNSGGSRKRQPGSNANESFIDRETRESLERVRRERQNGEDTNVSL